MASTASTIRGAGEKFLISPLKKIRRSLLDNARIARTRAAADWEIVARAPRGDRRGHLLVAAPGIMNTGDQAMLEAFIHSVPDPITVVVQPESTFAFDESGRDVAVVRIPALLVGRAQAHRAAIEQFADLASRHRTVSITGADVIDGGYHLTSAATTWAIAGAAAEGGADVRVLGFSWKPGVDPAVVEVARRATLAGVVANVRDPHSAQRAEKDGLATVRRVADSAFTLPDPEPRSADRKHVLLNVSGLIAGRVSLTDDYIQVIRALVARGLDVTIVAHVNNPSGSDAVASRALMEQLPTDLREHVTFIETLLRPIEIKSLAASAEFVITGRMHLSVLAMSMGVPAIVLSTQGKVSGLMELVGLEEFALEPVAGVAAQIERLIDRTLTGEPREILATRIGDVRAAAAHNFAGLTELDASGS